MKIGKVVDHVISLSLYEWADLDITLAAVLFYQSDKNDSVWFASNLLESIMSYPQKKIEEVRRTIAENIDSACSCRTTLSSSILHDAIVLSSLDSITTATGKAMIAEKSWLLRMLSQQMKNKVTAR